MTVDWRMVCDALYQDEKTDIWRSHRSFTNFVFENEARYGKSRNALARLLRMTRMYRLARESYPKLNLPEFSKMSRGVTGVAFNELSRVYTLLTEDDRCFLLRQVALGDLRKEHTTPVLSLYKHLLNKEGRLGRPKEGVPRFTNEGKDLVVELGKQAVDYFERLSHVSDVRVFDRSGQYAVTIEGVVIEKIFLLFGANRKPEVACLLFLGDGALSDESIAILQLFDFLVVPNKDAHAPSTLCSEALGFDSQTTTIHFDSSSTNREETFTVHKAVSNGIVRRFFSESLEIALRQH